MEKHETIVLVDSDFRRRATFSNLLAGTEIHVEPFESVDELVRCWPRQGLVLACDEGDQIRELVARMAKADNWLALVAYAPHPSTPRVVQAMLAGALDYLNWPLDEIEIRQVLTAAEVREGLPGNVKIRQLMARIRVQKLTRRECEVLASVADGLSNRLIGERLAISPRTVEIHRANMLIKLGANHTSEAIRIAIEAELHGLSFDQAA